jgi:transcriptional regulator with XRE-family HTH domain
MVSAVGVVRVVMARKPRFSREPFGATVRELMAASSITYRGLARQTGLSAGYLNHLVHGNRPVPDDDVIERLAQALGVGPEHFREYRLRTVVEQLASAPNTVDKLYKRLGAVEGLAGAHKT